MCAAIVSGWCRHQAQLIVTDPPDPRQLTSHGIEEPAVAREKRQPQRLGQRQVRRIVHGARRALGLTLTAFLALLLGRALHRLPARGLVRMPAGEAREILRLGDTTLLLGPDTQRWSADGRWSVLAVGRPYPPPITDRLLSALTVAPPVLTYWIAADGRRICAGARDGLPLGDRLLLRPPERAWANLSRLLPGDALVDLSTGAARRPRPEELRVLQTQLGAYAEVLALASQTAWPGRERTLAARVGASDPVGRRWSAVWNLHDGDPMRWTLHSTRLGQDPARPAVLTLDVSRDERESVASYPAADSLSPSLRHLVFAHDGRVWLLTLRRPLSELAAPDARRR